MPTDPDIAELQAKQMALVEKAEKLGQMRDGEDIVREAKKLSEEAKRLEAAAQEVAKKKAEEGARLQQKVGGTDFEKPRTIKVALTDDQRKRVLDDTGVRVEVVELQEGTDIPARAEDFMPAENPDLIEEIARRRAEEQKAKAAGDKQVRDTVGNAMAELEAQANTRDHEQLLRNLKKDPNFIGNLAKPE